MTSQLRRPQLEILDSFIIYECVFDADITSMSVTPFWRVLGLRMEEMVSRYGG